MTDLVDELRTAIGAETDMAMAAELGIERSTVSQWRRRGRLPKMYQAILDADRANYVLDGERAIRRQVYGDGPGAWFVRAALAVIPAKMLDYPELSPALLGEYRERLILALVPVLKKVSETHLGALRPVTRPEYDRLIEALGEQDSLSLIEAALSGPWF